MNKSNKSRQRNFNLLHPLDTLEGPASRFREIAPEYYIAESGDREWYVSLSELKRLNPDNYLDNGPASMKKIDRRAIERNIRSSKDYEPQIIQPKYYYKDPNQEWNDWFYGLQQKANQIEKEAAMAWRRVSSKIETSHVSCRNEPSVLPMPSSEIIEKMKREVQLVREMREKEKAEMPFWMRPTRDD